MTRSLFSSRFTSCLLLLLVFVLAGLTAIAQGQTPNLTFLNNYFVTGDSIVRSVDPGLSGPDANGFFHGTITIPSSSANPEGIPTDAEIVAAFLYWQTMETTGSNPSAAGVLFNGYSVTGDVTGTDIASSTGCWSSGSTIRTYRADVLNYLPVANGTYQAAGVHSVGLPANFNGNGFPGASLVVVYRVLSSNPLKAVVIYDGNSAMEYSSYYSGAPPFLDLPIRGFYDALGGNGTDIANAKFTDIFAVANGSTSSLLPTGSYTLPNTINGTFYPIDQIATDASIITSRTNRWGLQSGQCNVWGAMVFSTRVMNADGDGILDAWKGVGPHPYAPSPDTNQGKPGYYDAGDGSWVDLSGAQLGHKDLFVQVDYMVGTDGHSHQPDPQALTMVQDAFASQGIYYVHFQPGNAIMEETCTTDDLTTPLLCMFPNEPGVVGWKTGLEILKAWPLDPNDCFYGSGTCTPRFLPGARHSKHYVVFGHSLGKESWSTNAQTLTSIQVASGVGTVTTSAPITISSCPTRVTIDGALATPDLNGAYNVTGCSGNTFTIANPVPNTPIPVSDGTYPVPSGLPEPLLAIIPGATTTISGYSDVGGGDTAVTLGKWGTQAQRVNVQAGTLMHELGHTLGLLHGGRDAAPPGSSVLAADPHNCKSNYQSVMNYLFQVDLLGHPDTNHPYGYLDYSGEFLNTLDESNLSLSPGLSTTSNGPPAYSTTKWFSPYQPYFIGTPASRHCNGSSIAPNEPPMYLVEGAASAIAWSNVQDINFDGTISELIGFNDWWISVDPRQVSATASDYVGGIRLGGGGGIRLGGGGGIRFGGGGGIRLGGGGGIRFGGGGGEDEEIAFETADSYARPPLSVVSQPGGVTWNPPNFGNVSGYNIYRFVNGAAPVLIASVNNTTYSYTDPNPPQGATYTVTTILSDGRESTVANPPTVESTVTVACPPSVIYNGAPQTPCSATVTGTGGLNQALTVNYINNTNVGTATATASFAGNSTYSTSIGSASFAITSWTATGFYPPVSMSNGNTTVWNKIKGGRTVPLKFNIYAGGVQQTSIGAVQGGTVYVWSLACNNTGLVNYATDYLLDTGATALRYDGSQFIQNWKTPQGAGLCYVAIMTAADNVTTLQAYFQTN